MPQVPVYDRQIREKSLPNTRIDARISPQDFGTEVGDVVQRIGLDIWDREVKKADEVAVMAAVGRLKEYTNAKLYDPNNGVLNKRGRDAFDISEISIQEYDKKISEIENGVLANDNQRIAFRRQAMAMRGDFDLTLQRHVANEIKAYDREEFENFIKSSRDRAALNYEDPILVASETESIRTEAIKFAKRHGLGPQWVDRFVSDTISATHVAVIDRMLANGQDLKAKEYYKVVKNAITGADATKIEKAVEAGSLRAESQKIADSIVLNTPDKASIYAKVREISDPQLRDAVQQRIDAELAKRDQAQRENQEDITVAMATMVDRGIRIDQLKGSLAWQNLTLSQRSALENYARIKDKGDEVKTDWATYYELSTMAYTAATQDKFMKLNLMAYRDKLSDSEFRQLTQIQGALRSREDRKDIKDLLQGMRTTAQIVNDSLEAVNINPNPKPGSKDAKRVAEFRRSIDERIIAFKAANGRPPSDVEIQQLVDLMLTKGKVRGSGIIFDDVAFAFEADKERPFIISIKDIPSSEVNKIKQALTRAGKPTTDAEVIKLYNLRLRSIGVNAPIPVNESKLEQIPR